MKQRTTLILALFLTLTITVTCGAVEPSNTEKIAETISTERVSILETESMHQESIRQEEQALQDQTEDEERSESTDDTNVIVKMEETPTAGPINSQLRSESTPDFDQAPAQSGEDADPVDGTKRNDQVIGEEESDSNKIIDGEILEGDTDPSTDADDNTPDAVLEEDTDDQNQPDRTESDVDNSTKPTVDLNQPETDDKNSNDNTKLDTETVPDEDIDGNAVSKTDALTREDSDDPSDDTDRNPDTEIVDEKSLIQIQPQISQNRDKTTTALNQDQNQLIQSAKQDRKPNTQSDQAPLQDSFSEETVTPKESTHLSAKEQFAQKEGILSKTTFLMKEFGLWLTELVGGLAWSVLINK